MSDTGPKKDLLDIGVFEVFVQKYRDRYGDAKMSNDTAAGFYDQLCEMKTGHFKTVTDVMIADQKWGFGWLQVIERMNIFFPSPGLQQILNEKWKLDHVDNPEPSKERAFKQLMTCIPDLAKKNPESWRVDFFTKVYDLLGGDECALIVVAVQNEFPEFKAWLYAKSDFKGGD